VDFSSADRDRQMREVERVLVEIGAEFVPRIVVYNKIDRAGVPAREARDESGAVAEVWLSALDGQGLDLLRSALDAFFAHREAGPARHTGEADAVEREAQGAGPGRFDAGRDPGRDFSMTGARSPRLSGAFAAGSATGVETPVAGPVGSGVPGSVGRGAGAARQRALPPGRAAGRVVRRTVDETPGELESVEAVGQSRAA